MNIYGFIGLPGALVDQAITNFSNSLDCSLAFIDFNELVCRQAECSTLSELFVVYGEDFARKTEYKVLKQIDNLLSAKLSEPELVSRLISMEQNNSFTNNLCNKHDIIVSNKKLNTTTLIIKFTSGLFEYTKNLELWNTSISNLITLYYVDTELEICTRNAGLVGGAPAIGQPRKLWMQMAKQRRQLLTSIADEII